MRQPKVWCEPSNSSLEGNLYFVDLQDYLGSEMENRPYILLSFFSESSLMELALR